MTHEQLNEPQHIRDILEKIFDWMVPFPKQSTDND